MLITAHPQTAWLTIDVWGRILGAARRNAICVTITHPVAEFVAALREISQQAKEADALLKILPRRIPDAQATALYARIVCINHSCMPNAEVHFLSDNHEATLLAKRDIPAGTEVTISYIDDNERAGFLERRVKLRDYGFNCQCEKCVGEEMWTRRLRPRRAAA